MYMIVYIFHFAPSMSSESNDFITCHKSLLLKNVTFWHKVGIEKMLFAAHNLWRKCV